MHLQCNKRTGLGLRQALLEIGCFFVSCLCDTERTATFIALGSFLPMMLLCGIIWPSEEITHKLEKRGTIIAGPVFPRCVFYECIAKCRQKGYKSGGYCTINGCQCLR